MISEWSMMIFLSVFPQLFHHPMVGHPMVDESMAIQGLGSPSAAARSRSASLGALDQNWAALQLGARNSMDFLWMFSMDVVGCILNDSLVTCG